MPVRMIEINSESAASLIQTVTVSQFPVGPIAECRNCVDILAVMLWRFRAARCGKFS